VLKYKSVVRIPHFIIFLGFSLTLVVEELNSGIELTTVGLRKMLERGRSISWRDSQGNSLLHYACMRTQVDPLRFLIEVYFEVGGGKKKGQCVIIVFLLIFPPLPLRPFFFFF
jgi:hypothetical protein